MSLLHAPSVQRWLGRYLLCRVDGADLCFAPTFDDGPSPRNTPRLLEVLRRHQARATFFLMARRARRHVDLLKRMASEGHELGIHGDLHLPAVAMPNIWLDGEIARASDVIRAATGSAPRFYRAPFGTLRPGQAARIRACGLVPVLGSVYPRDPGERKPATIASRVLARLGSGDVLILHDSSPFFDFDRSATIAAVDAILDATTARGLRSVTLSELLASRTPV